MNALTAKRQQLIKAIEDLPNEALSELASFIDYLHYKTAHVDALELEEEGSPNSTFLLSIAGLGASVENDLSERDEEVLADEVDPIRGWSLKSHHQA